MMRTWSVEIEANDWNDDLFNGTYEECVEYCKENGYEDARLAEIDPETGYCYEIIAA